MQTFISTFGVTVILRGSNWFNVLMKIFYRNFCTSFRPFFLIWRKNILGYFVLTKIIGHFQYFYRYVWLWIHVFCRYVFTQKIVWLELLLKLLNAQRDKIKLLYKNFSFQSNQGLSSTGRYTIHVRLCLLRTLFVCFGFLNLS